MCYYAHLDNVNPFDQNGVEEYKRLSIAFFKALIAKNAYFLAFSCSFRKIIDFIQKMIFYIYKHKMLKKKYGGNNMTKSRISRING